MAAAPLTLSVALALGSGLVFGIGNQCSRMGLRHVDPQTATLFQIGVGMLLYWLAAPFYMKAEYWTSAALPLLAAIGLFRPVLSANLSMAGTRILGPTISSTVAGTAPLFGVALGVVLLSETLSWPVAVGTGGIVLGVVLLSWRRGGASAGWPLAALLFPLSAAFLRSFAHGIAKIGMEDIPSPLFVALIAYTVSFPLALGYTLWRGEFRPRRIPRNGVGWLVSTGLLYGIAVLLLNAALLTGQLIVVSPLVACTPIFTLILGYFVFREERLSAPVVGAVLIVVPSVVLISLRG